MREGKPTFEGISDTLQEALRNEEDLGRRLVWDISAIAVHMTRIADLLGKRIGVSGSQWITITAIDGLSDGEGVSVRDVAALLNVDGSFVSAQSKILEKQGLVRRAQSAGDKRLVLLSLTDLAVGRLNELESSKYTLEQHVRGELADQPLHELSETLITMRRRLGRAMLLVAAGEE